MVEESELEGELPVPPQPDQGHVKVCWETLIAHLSQAARNLLEQLKVAILAVSQTKAEGSNVILVNREILEKDLGLQVDGARHLIPVCQCFGPAGDARGALGDQESHQDPDCLRHLDLLKNVKLFIVVCESP